MKKKAIDLKKGDKISMGGEWVAIEEIETSDISKQGQKKCRITGKKEDGERSL